MSRSNTRNAYTLILCLQGYYNKPVVLFSPVHSQEICFSETAARSILPFVPSAPVPLSLPLVI